MQQTVQTLNATFAALSDPTRRAILSRLAEGPATVSELMEPFTLSQPAISKHLKVLEQAGLVMQDRDAQRRPRTLTPGALEVVDVWLAPFRIQWEQRFRNLDRYAQTITLPSPKTKKRK